MLLALSVPVFAANDTAVFVTICDKDGKIALAQEKINVTDADGDGTLTITDALFCAHEAKYTAARLRDTQPLIPHTDFQ